MFIEAKVYDKHQERPQRLQLWFTLLLLLVSFFSGWENQAVLEFFLHIYPQPTAKVTEEQVRTLLFITDYYILGDQTRVPEGCLAAVMRKKLLLTDITFNQTVQTHESAITEPTHQF